MKAVELEYLKEYRHIGMPGKQICYLGLKGKKYWFVEVKGKELNVCSGRWWMNSRQIENLITEP